MIIYNFISPKLYINVYHTACFNHTASQCISTHYNGYIKSNCHAPPHIMSVFYIIIKHKVQQISSTIQSQTTHVPSIISFMRPLHMITFRDNHVITFTKCVYCIYAILRLICIEGSLYNKIYSSNQPPRLNFIYLVCNAPR